MTSTFRHCADTHAPIWREHWKPLIIQHDNRASWFTCKPDQNLAANRWPKVRGVKDDYKRSMGLLGFEYLISVDELNDAEYLHEMRPEIGRLVTEIINPEMLRAIAKTIHLDDFKFEDWPMWRR